MSEISTPNAELHLRRQAFLLDQLTFAPAEQLTQSAVNKAIPSPIKLELTLSPALANQIRSEMTNHGWVETKKVGRVVSYRITDVGRQQWAELQRYVPLLPAKGTPNRPLDQWEQTARSLYVLDALDRAPGHSFTKADLDAAFGGRPKLTPRDLVSRHPGGVLFRDQLALGLNAATTREVLSALVLDGSVGRHRGEGSEIYSLTPIGRQRLPQLRTECPVLPPCGMVKQPPRVAVEPARHAYLLLEILQTPEGRRSASEVMSARFPSSIHLNAPTAWQVRTRLVREGHLSLQTDGMNAEYALTSKGKQYLTTLSFDELGEFKIQGLALTELLRIARTARPTEIEVRPAKSPDALIPSSKDLETVVIEITNQLLRERFQAMGMVPIHELRSAITLRMGATASSHGVLDSLLLELRRAKKVRLISISDRSRATPEQLQESVHAVGETFFYVELCHAAGHSG